MKNIANVKFPKSSLYARIKPFWTEQPPILTAKEYEDDFKSLLEVVKKIDQTSSDNNKRTGEVLYKPFYGTFPPVPGSFFISASFREPNNITIKVEANVTWDSATIDDHGLIKEYSLSNKRSLDIIYKEDVSKFDDNPDTIFDSTIDLRNSHSVNVDLKTKKITTSYDLRKRKGK